MRTVTVTFDNGKGYRVSEGDGYHDQLTWDEMLGQIAELTHPRVKVGRYPMYTEAQWKLWNERRYEELQASEAMPLGAKAETNQGEENVNTGNSNSQS
jgi:hypothetical protein